MPDPMIYTIDGQWYVYGPNLGVLGGIKDGGPFRTRRQARRWLRAERSAGRLPGRVLKPAEALQGPSEGGT